SNSPLTPLGKRKTKKIKFPLKDEKISLQKNNKDKKMTSPLRSDHAALSLHFVPFGSLNKG
ncbi:hypothetical protein KKH38_02920, partial [Patescibacteria group bacterium]|nr:hypothetical protein [Patescibacteria group bacterium]MBU4600824.1 hypothetical protein [Patescibacteria group bacterium]